MSEQKVFIAGYIPDEQSVKDFGARRVATAFHAKDEKHAAAKASFIFMEEYPGAQDAAYKHLLCEEVPGIPRPALNDWDEDFLYEYDWSEDLGHPVAIGAGQEPQPVEFEKLSQLMKIAILVKYDRAEITTDLLPAALELTQGDVGTFEGHIVEAINKTPEIASMYPEKIIYAIGWVKHKCAPTKKWPEIKAELHNWKKRQDEDRKETGPSKSVVDIARDKAANQRINQGVEKSALKSGSGDPDRFDIVVALLVMGKDPSTAGATDVKNAKHIKESRDLAWRGWRTTLVGIPGIYDFPEHLLYELTLDGMKDLSLIKDNEGRLAYVRDHFAGHPLLPDYPIDEKDSHETEQNTAASAGALEPESPETNTVAPQHVDDVPAAEAVETAPSVEREGPFYWRNIEGTKIGRANKFSRLQEIIAEGNIEISQEEHQARKTGTFTGADVGKQLAAERGEYVEGISDPNDPKWVKEDQSAPQPEVTNHGNGRFSIDSLGAEQPKSQVQESPKATADAAKNAEAQPSAPSQVDYQSIGASLESELEAKGDNLQIWRRVMRTDPRYTKELSGAGFEGTSINAEYMVMRATEIFGPIGSGWGFEVLEERMIPGAPMSEAIYEDKKFVGNRLLRDADGTLITEQNHSIKIEFWYQDAGNKKRFESYGATKYLYKSKHGITCDGEAQKKSLTDAIKKALSLLGFSADVWLGLYDQAEYKQENAIEFDIRNASDKAEDVTRIRKELDEKFKLNTESMRAAVTPNEVSGIASSLTRVMGVHLKAAREKADLEYAKYLEGRLRRLEEVKTECLTKLQEKAA